VLSYPVLLGPERARRGVSTPVEIFFSEIFGADRKSLVYKDLGWAGGPAVPKSLALKDLRSAGFRTPTTNLLPAASSLLILPQSVVAIVPNRW